MLALVRGLGPDDTVLCLISGGGSALLPLPLEGISLEDEQAVNRALLRWSATIGEMNCVRRHLSAIKGVRLGAACHPARVLTLLISDVPGDRPCDIVRADDRRPEHSPGRARDRAALRHRAAGCGARAAGKRPR